jgi:peptide/nickel transport system permease protein
LTRALRSLVRRPSSLAALIVLAVTWLLGLVGPTLAPISPEEITSKTLQSPSLEHLLGTDSLGRDVFSRFLAGTRVSVLVSFLAVAVGVTFGTLIGLRAGLRVEGWWDTALMRTMDVILTFPLLIIVPLIAQLIRQRELSLGPLEIGTWPVIALALGIAMTPTFARITRSGVISEMEEMYIAAARTFGTRGRHLVFGNVLPNVAAPLIVQTSFSLGSAIVAEAGISYLGLGIQPPGSSWGILLSDGQKFVSLGAWWLVVFPAGAIALVALATLILGDTLRSILDPRSLTSGIERQVERLAAETR